MTAVAGIRARVADLVEDDADRPFVAGMLRSFAGRLPVLADRLAAALDAADPATAADRAHALKGAAGNVGATALAAACAAVEQAARAGHVPDATAVRAELAPTDAALAVVLRELV